MQLPDPSEVHPDERLDPAAACRRACAEWKIAANIPDERFDGRMAAIARMDRTLAAGGVTRQAIGVTDQLVARLCIAPPPHPPVLPAYLAAEIDLQSGFAPRANVKPCAPFRGALFA